MIIQVCSDEGIVNKTNTYLNVILHGLLQSVLNTTAFELSTNINITNVIFGDETPKMERVTFSFVKSKCIMVYRRMSQRLFLPEN